MRESTAAATAVIVRSDDAGEIEVLMLRRPRTGTFADAWVFPGGRIEQADRADDADEVRVALRAAVRETWEEVGLLLDPAAVRPFTRWVPPADLVPRLPTHFFVAADPGGELSPQPSEVVQARWVVPSVMLDLHTRGGAVLVAPTYVTLRWLALAPSLDAVLAGDYPVPEHRTRRVETDGGAVMVWAPDVAHATGDLQRPGPRHRLDTRRLPWTYARED